MSGYFSISPSLHILEILTKILKSEQDVRHILGEDDESSMVLGLTAPQVDACLLMTSGSASASSVGTAGEDLAGVATNSIFICFLFVKIH